MEKCCRRIHAKLKRRKATWGRDNNALILRIDSSSSSNYYRIYQKINGLRFELELKNQVVKSFQKDGSHKKINKFQPQDITQIKVISFYENIHYKSLLKRR